MEIKLTYDINSVCKDLVELSKKEGLLFNKNILFFILYNNTEVVGFFGLKIHTKTANIKCDYVTKKYRGNKLLTKMIIHRINWLRKHKPSVNKISLTTTPMATNSHLRCGAKIVKTYKNGITKLEYEIL
jgi:hypothetical protein